MSKRTITATLHFKQPADPQPWRIELRPTAGEFTDQEIRYAQRAFDNLQSIAAIEPTERSLQIYCTGVPGDTPFQGDVLNMARGLYEVVEVVTAA